VNSLRDLKKELNDGNRQEAEVRARRYLTSIGINPDELPMPDFDELTVGMYRQVPTSNLESVVVKNLLDTYGIRRTDIGLYSDHYVSSSSYKSSLVRPRTWNGHVRKKKLAKPREGEVLREIKTLTGERLTGHHENLYRERIASDMDEYSELYSKVLEESLSNGHIHKRVWVMEDGLAKPYMWDEEKRLYRSKNGEKSLEDVITLSSRSLARPDAGWYYSNIHLFQPGILLQNFVMVECPWEMEDEKIRGYAEKSYAKVMEITGTFPDLTPTGNFYQDSRRIEEMMVGYARNRERA